MSRFLNSVRSAEIPISVNRKIINTMAVLCLGIALGTFSKFLDTMPANCLPPVFACLDIRNFLGRFAVWVLIAPCISVYSNSSASAGVNVFAFFAGLTASYYLYSKYIAGFFPAGYAAVWFCFTALSAFPAFVCWYAKGKSKPALILSILILAVLFNMTFVYGWGYFEARSVLETAVFFIGCIVLKRRTLKESVLMGVCGIAAALFLNMVIPFHFG